MGLCLLVYTLAQRQKGNLKSCYLVKFILKTAENYTYLTFAHPVLKPQTAENYTYLTFAHPVLKPQTAENYTYLTFAHPVLKPQTAENYTYLTFAHPVLKPLPASGRGLERGSILSVSEVLNRSQYSKNLNIIFFRQPIQISGISMP